MEPCILHVLSFRAIWIPLICSDQLPADAHCLAFPFGISLRVSVELNIVSCIIHVPASIFPHYNQFAVFAFPSHSASEWDVILCLEHLRFCFNTHSCVFCPPPQFLFKASSKCFWRSQNSGCGGSIIQCCRAHLLSWFCHIIANVQPTPTDQLPALSSPTTRFLLVCVQKKLNSSDTSLFPQALFSSLNLKYRFTDMLVLITV